MGGQGWSEPIGIINNCTQKKARIFKLFMPFYGKIRYVITANICTNVHTKIMVRYDLCKNIGHFDI